jgi:hypothetical protein
VLQGVGLLRGVGYMVVGGWVGGCGWRLGGGEGVVMVTPGAGFRKTAIAAWENCWLGEGGRGGLATLRLCF